MTPIGIALILHFFKMMTNLPLDSDGTYPQDSASDYGQEEHTLFHDALDDYWFPYEKVVIKSLKAKGSIFEDNDGERPP